MSVNEKSPKPVPMTVSCDMLWQQIVKKIKESKHQFQKIVLLSPNGDLLARQLKINIQQDFPNIEIAYFRPACNQESENYFQLPYAISVAIKNQEAFNQLIKKHGGELKIPSELNSEIYEVQASRVLIEKKFDEMLEYNESLAPEFEKPQPAVLVTLGKETEEDLKNVRKTFIQYSQKIWKCDAITDKAEIATYMESETYKC